MVWHRYQDREYTLQARYTHLANAPRSCEQPLLCNGGHHNNIHLWTLNSDANISLQTSPARSCCLEFRQWFKEHAKCPVTVLRNNRVSQDPSYVGRWQEISSPNRCLYSSQYMSICLRNASVQTAKSPHVVSAQPVTGCLWGPIPSFTCPACQSVSTWGFPIRQWVFVV